MSKLTYSTTVPTKGGYYWLRSPDHDKGAIVEVFYSRTWKEWRFYLDSGTEFPLGHPHYKGFLWAGPLVEPEVKP